MDGNQKEIRSHKKTLIDWVSELKSELRALSYHKFSSNINRSLAEMNKFTQLREKEKEHNQRIKQVIEDEQ